jgi:hypothetical protein
MSWNRHPVTVMQQTLGRKNFEQFAQSSVFNSSAFASAEGETFKPPFAVPWFNPPNREPQKRPAIAQNALRSNCVAQERLRL